MDDMENRVVEDLNGDAAVPAAGPGGPTLDKGDVIALSVAALSLLVALASLVFSIKTHYEAKIEQLAIRFSPRQTLDEARLLPFASGVGKPGILQEAWGCLLSNNGDRTISLVEHEVFVVTDKGQLSYSHINGGLLDRAGQPVELPITLEPGESRLVYLVVGLLIEEAASSLLAEAFGTRADASLHQIEMFLADHGLDVYGNERKITRFDGGGFVIEGPGSERAEQVFVVTFRSGRGHRFSVATSLYAAF